MKTLAHRYVLTAAFFIAPSLAQAATISDYFPNCGAPAAQAVRTLTVDLTRRAASAYPSVATALQAAKPGDTVALTTGDYGDLDLEKVSFPDFVTITAAPGQTPRFTKITIGRSSHLRLSGLSVVSMSKPENGKWIHNQLIQVSVSDHIILDHNDISSSAGAMTWLPELSDSPVGDAPSHGISARSSSCVSITDNHIHNVFHGIDFGGPTESAQYILVGGNKIDNFAGDGIEHYASHVRIENNRITDGHDLCKNQCVHMDGIQGWNYNHLPIQNSDVTIDGNVIIAQTDPNLVFPADMLQGITIFDGTWHGVKIYNNVVVATAWHGITVNWADDVSIVNNTVLSADPARTSWIMFHSIKDQPLTRAIIRNNFVTSAVKADSYPKGTIVDHNLSAKRDAYSDVFVKFDLAQSAYDLRPAKGSVLIGSGTEDQAPSVDLDGNARKNSNDVGAYSYQHR